MDNYSVALNNRIGWNNILQGGVSFLKFNRQ